MLPQNKQQLIRQHLKSTQKEYLTLIQTKKAELSRAPQGKLRSKKQGNNYFYYYITNPEDTNGKYLSNKLSNKKLIQKLAQRDYDTKILKQLIDQEKLIRRFLAKYNPEGILETFNQFSKSKKKLITPIYKTQEEFIKE